MLIAFLMAKDKVGVHFDGGLGQASLILKCMFVYRMWWARVPVLALLPCLKQRPWRAIVSLPKLARYVPPGFNFAGYWHKNQPPDMRKRLLQL